MSLEKGFISDILKLGNLWQGQQISLVGMSHGAWALRMPPHPGLLESSASLLASRAPGSQTEVSGGDFPLEEPGPVATPLLQRRLRK